MAFPPNYNQDRNNRARAKAGDVRARDDFRAAALLQLRDAAGMIEMHVRIENDLDVAELEAELLDVLRDERRGFRQGAVDQNMTLWRSDEHRAQAMRADIVSVAVDPKRRLIFVPHLALRAFILCRRGGADGERGEQRQRESQH